MVLCATNCFFFQALNREATTFNFDSHVAHLQSQTANSSTLSKTEIQQVVGFFRNLRKQTFSDKVEVISIRVQNRISCFIKVLEAESRCAYSMITNVN